MQFTHSNRFPTREVLYKVEIGQENKATRQTFCNLLTEIKLKVKAGTHNTFSRTKLVVT